MQPLTVHVLPATGGAPQTLTPAWPGAVWVPVVSLIGPKQSIATCKGKYHAATQRLFVAGAVHANVPAATLYVLP